MEIFNIYTNELNSVTAYHFILRPFESRIALKIIVSLLEKNTCSTTSTSQLCTYSNS